MITPFLDGLDLAMFAHFFPFIAVIFAIVFLMCAKMFRINVTVTFIISMAFLVGAWAVGFGDVNNIAKENLYGMSVDSIGELGIKILIPAVMIISLMIMRKIATPGRKIEALLLILISCFGAMVTLVSSNWMLFFIGLQCLSLPLYGLLAFDTDDRASLSSSMRYVLLSFVAMAIMLFGILLLYAATATMDLVEQSARIATLSPASHGVIGLALIMILIGIAFKVSLFPFHAWAPEVYSGARLFVLSYFMVVVKSVVVIFLMRITTLFISADQTSLFGIIAFMSLLSMWIGNGMMLREQSLIRVLAFMSIGHLGALMIPILAHNNLSFEAIFLDVIAFGLAMLLLFAALNAMNKINLRNVMLSDLVGLYNRHPRASIAFAIALISLTGFPLTAGFVGKFAIFQSGVAASLWHLVMHFVLSSVVGLVVIARIVASLWLNETSIAPHEKQKAPRMTEVLVCVTVAILAMGVMPEPWIALVKHYLQ